MSWFIFIFLSLLCVGSVAAMLLSRNQAHNALFLVLCFASLGGIFGLLHAPFIAFVQVIIYAGAIMVLFLFAVMTVNLRQGLPPEKKKSVHVFSAILAATLLAELLFAVRGLVLKGGGPALSGGGDPAGLGRVLFSHYLYPFEITSLLLLAALVGALPLAKKKEGT